MVVYKKQFLGVYSDSDKARGGRVGLEAAASEVPPLTGAR